MNSLLQQLADIDPCISAGQAAEFRTVSLAIAQRLQGEPTSLPLSLNDWWQWLDDEGYDRDIFGPILGRICSARMDDSAYHGLLGFLQANADLTEGIPTLHQYVHALHPELEQQLDNLLAVAHEEETQMNNVAGGASKKEKIWIPIVAIGTPLTIGLIIWGVKRKGSERVKDAVEYSPIGKSEKLVEGKAKAEAEQAVNHKIEKTEDMLHRCLQRYDRDGRMIAKEDINADTFTKKDADKLANFYNEKRNLFNFDSFAKKRVNINFELSVRLALRDLLLEAESDHPLHEYEAYLYQSAKEKVKEGEKVTVDMLLQDNKAEKYGNERAINDCIRRDVLYLNTGNHEFDHKRLIEFFEENKDFLTENGKKFLKEDAIPKQVEKISERELVIDQILANLVADLKNKATVAADNKIEVLNNELKLKAKSAIRSEKNSVTNSLDKEARKGEVDIEVKVENTMEDERIAEKNLAKDFE
jgi:hypothetical protein